MKCYASNRARQNRTELDEPATGLQFDNAQAAGTIEEQLDGRGAKGARLPRTLGSGKKVGAAPSSLA